jgi:molybdopterin converting factor small subunit
MAVVKVNFNGIWRRYLNVADSTVEAGDLDEAFEKIEGKFGPSFQAKWAEMGMRTEGSIMKYASMMLNGKNAKTLQERQLKDDDVIDVLLPVFGG